ncbi:hypothetical protein COL87_05370 [Bacillus pseudomycoides]|nr:hypothetical protein COO06_10600 [Bacillus pseudomycoides]PEF75916.1 hypothetical protein CON94_07190 [Bacillus pseudomycoides]PEI41722.1 hypothetical protein CN641_21910 [Bacillus pseudomycoides]PEL90246.1 hypothetical protein CN615_05175 [Bacillus pseudomycoides]PEM40653.1 hypothetical protein CN634_06415 [Bacillus pseudomycoides]
MLLFHVSFVICNPTFDGEKDVGLDVCIGVFFCYNVRMHKRKFKKSGQDNLRISSLLCQSGTHVVYSYTPCPPGCSASNSSAL